MPALAGDTGALRASDPLEGHALEDVDWPNPYVLPPSDRPARVRLRAAVRAATGGAIDPVRRVVTFLEVYRRGES